MIIRVAFELDGDGVRDGGPDIQQHLEFGEDLVLDLSDVTRMDSSGLGLLVMAQKRKLEQGRRLSLRNVAGQPLALLRRFKLLTVLGHESSPTKEPSVHTQPVAA